MRDMLDTLLRWSALSGGPDHLLELTAKATVVLGGAGAIALLLRRAPAAARHLVWTLGLGGLLVLPIAAAVLPPLPGWWTLTARQAVPLSPGPVASATTEAIAPTTFDAPAPSDEPPAAAVAVAGSAPVADTPGSARFSWRAWLLPLWGAGAVLVLLAIAASLARIALLHRDASVETRGDWLALLAAVAAETGVRRPVTLLRSVGPAMPMTWGLRRPVVLLPAGADAWPTARRRDVLRHELAHVRRGDWTTQLLARIACAVYWFHPLAWMAARALRVERERACDDQVLRAGTLPSAYATHLLDIARGFRAESALAGVAMARPSQLATRLLDVLDAGRRRTRMTAQQVCAAAVLALLVLLPLAAAAPAAAAAELAFPRFAMRALPPEPAGTAPVFAAASPGFAQGVATTAPAVPDVESRAPTAAEMRALLADTLPECVGASPHGDHHSVSVNRGMAVTTTVGRCWLRFVAEGKIAFNDDYTDVASVSSRGLVQLETDNGDTDRELEIRPRNGTLERRYRVNRADQPYDAAARRWVAGALTVMFRSSGVAAEERAQWILQRQGIAGLLDELAQLQGDYTRRRYAEVALSSDKLDAAGRERVITWAGQNIRSDHDLAQVLIAAGAGPLPPSTQAAFVAAARTLQSDFEMRRVLATVLARSELDARAAGAVLEAAQDINSDYELAQLLIQWMQGREIDEALRPAFFRAANTLQSDFEHRRVLAAAVGRGRASQAVVIDALASAKAIGSDFELAQVLTAVVDFYPLDPPTRAPFFAAVATLNSSFERRRVLGALAEHRDLPADLIAEVLRAAGDMNAGYDRSQVLVTVAEHQRLTAPLQRAYQDAASGLSGYEYDRAMAALGKTLGRQPL